MNQLDDEMRAYWKSLPLLLMSSFLMIGAAWAFFKGKDSTASIAAFAAGLILLGAWMTTALLDWDRGHKPQGPQSPPESEEEGPDGHDEGE